MGIHTGEKCFVCGLVFTDNDDVVVCPDCGTPYHRACWQKNGACVNLPLHESGKSWQPEKKAEEEAQMMRICPDCGTSCPKDATHCPHCGKPFLRPEEESDTPPATFREQLRETAQRMGAQDATCGLDPAEDLDGERLEDVANFVAQNNLYYLPKFLRFSKEHRISLNFPCLLFPQYYLAYRKMWGISLVLIGVLSLLHVPQSIVQLELMFQQYLPMLREANAQPEVIQFLQNMIGKLDAHETLLNNIAMISSYFEIVLSILLGLFGNRIYYRFVMRRVHKLVQEDVSPEMRRIRLRQEGGTNGWFILGAFGIQMGFAMILSLIILLCLFAL